MMPTTFQSSALNGSFFVATWKMWSMVPWDIRSGLCTAQMDTHDTNSSTTATGAQMAAHCRNDIWIPVRDSSMPMAMMFMLLPEGNASPPMAAAYGMAIMTARPNRDSPGTASSNFRMVLVTMPENRAQHGRSETNSETHAAESMKARMTPLVLPLEIRSRAYTILYGILVFSNAADRPNDARMKNRTLLTKLTHTVGPSLPPNGSTPNAGMQMINAKPDTPNGTGSHTHNTTPASRSPRLIFPEKESEAASGRNANSTTTRTAATQHSRRARTEACLSTENHPSMTVVRRTPTRKGARRQGGEGPPWHRYAKPLARYLSESTASYAVSYLNALRVVTRMRITAMATKGRHNTQEPMAQPIGVTRYARADPPMMLPRLRKTLKMPMLMGSSSTVATCAVAVVSMVGTQPWNRPFIMPNTSRMA